MKLNEQGILLIEDDLVDVMNVKRAFKKSAITSPLYTAGNGLEALEFLRGTSGPRSDPFPNLILLDLNMPMMGGLEFLAEIRKDPSLKSLSVFVLTTSAREKDVVAAYEYNVAGYILKPLAFEDFLQSVNILKNYWGLIEYVNNEG